MVLDGVKIGDVEFRDAEFESQTAGDIEWFGVGGVEAADGAVFIASSAHAANDLAAHQVEDGNDAHDLLNSGLLERRLSPYNSYGRSDLDTACRPERPDDRDVAAVDSAVWGRRWCCRHE